jgi:hypothetical protein
MKGMARRTARARLVLILARAFGLRVFEQGRTLGWGVLALACLLLGGFLKFPEAVETPGSDTGMFATYGAMLLHGARPYVDFWDVHPPLVYVYWAFVQSVTGTDWLRTCFTLVAIAPQSCTGLVAHSLDLLLSVVAALVVAAMVRRGGGSTATAAVAALLVVGFADQVMLSQEGSNPSKLTLVPTSVAVWAYLASEDEHGGRCWALLAGTAGTIAGLAKQPALLTLAALVGDAAWRRDRTRMTSLLLGSGATLAIVYGALAAVGSLEGFVAQTWIYNLERTVSGYFVNPAKPPVIGLDRVLLESAGTLGALALVGGFVIARSTLYSRQRLIVAWAVANVIAVTAFREFVYVVPSFAAVGALGLERIWWRLGMRHRPIARGLLVIVCAGALVLTTGFQRTQLARARFERGPNTGVSPTEELGLRLRTDFGPGPLFIYGNGAQLYPLADRTPATRYLNAEALRSTAPGVEQTRAELVADLSSKPPAVIILAPHSDEPELNLEEYPAMRAILQDCYAPQPSKPRLDASWTVLVHTRACHPRGRIS